MAKNNFFVKKGFVQKSKENISGGFNLNRFLKQTLEDLHITRYDECCDEDLGIVPVRYSTSNNLIEYFNGTDWVSTGITIKTNTIQESTSGSGVTVDGVLLKDGGVTANSMYAGFFPSTAAQSLSGAGAVNVTSYLTKFTSTGAAQALTIASGTQIGQRKKISHVVDGGSGVLTGVFVGGTTITFTTVGEFADLIWTGSAWAVLELGNTATPATIPALA